MVSRGVAALRVVRQQSSSLSQTHELALCNLTSVDPFVEVVFKNREVECTLDEFTKTFEINKTSIEKAYVFHAIERDLDELRAKCPEYSDVRRHPHCLAPPFAWHTAWRMTWHIE